MSSMRIAALEDDVDQAHLVKHVLTFAGHDCHIFSTGKSLLYQLSRGESYDLLILDWQLPDIPGPDVVRWIRTHNREKLHLPIIFLTGRTDERDIVDGLSCGADDYMVKPIRRNELMARVNALLRRTYPLVSAEVLQVGVYTIDTRVRKVSVNGKPIVLTQKEFQLMQFLFCNPNRLLSRRHILESVWGKENIPTRTIDTHISRLRNKLMIGPEHGFRLVSVYSLGYRLECAGDQTEQPTTMRESVPL